MALTRADLRRVPSYIPGRRGSVTGQPPARMASNEVPYGPLPGVVEALATAAAESHRYPDNGVGVLKERLAQRHGLDPRQLVTGCGSVAVAEHLIKATALPGDEVIYPWRSFEAYPMLVTGAGVTPVTVPLTSSYELDLPAMAAAVTERTRLIFVCTPNNPTGTAVGRESLERFLASVPSSVLVVLDEAYVEFVTDPDGPDGLSLLARHPNLAVLRTFSKAWGLAGLRLGWLATAEPVATEIQKIVTTFSTSLPAQAAAVAALDAEAEMRRRCELIVSERGRVTAAVRELGFEVPASQGNFIWLPVGDRTAELTAACDAVDVLVRGFASDGIRVTISTPEENDRFLAALRSTR